MDYSLEYYRFFYNVAKHGSITKAADELHISQPAVSQAIKNLEASLGSRLFYRTSKGVRLTPEGEVLFEYISKGYEYISLGEKKFRELLDLESGEVRVGASDMTLGYYLLPHLERFHSLFPKIKVKVSNAPTPETIACLRSGDIDFGVVSSPIIDVEGLSITPVAKINDIFVGGSRFTELMSRTVLLSELEKLPIVCLEENTSTRRYINDFLGASGVLLQPEFELATSDLIVKFAEKNLGIGSVVRDFARESLARGDIFELMLEKPIPARNICVVTSEKTPMSPAGKRLLSILYNPGL